jgi:threonylcarbamoyladenosine tRNA methylthiotransferase MtaB
MGAKTKTFKIYTLGCKVNQYDSRYLRTLLTRQGYEYVPSGADLVIVNTCAVTRKAIGKDKRMINRAKKENPDARIILMGCWPQVYESQVQQLDVDVVWGVGRLNDLMIYIEGLLGGGSRKESTRVTSIVSEERARYFLKIQDGCDHFCSYCVIPYARGRARSREENELLKEAEGVGRAGFEELVISGIHLGMYGKDTGTDIVELLKKMVKIAGIKRVRLSSIEINEISEELLEFMTSSEKICNHLHIPLQSGSDRILAAMNRPYTGQEFEERVRRIRIAIPDIAISGDVMVGFPGETEQDFKYTHDIVNKLKFSRLHVFPFSAHPETPASKMSDQVPAETAKQRSSQLLRSAEGLEREFKESFRGKELDVVVGNVASDRMRGTTEYYFDIDFSLRDIVSYHSKDIDDPQRIVGKVVRVKYK